MTKKERLARIFEEMGPCAVAFSGGVDSCVLARAAQETAGQKNWKVLAVTAESPSTPRADLEVIRNLATEIGIPHQFVKTHEMELPEYRANSPKRCYFCKRHILGQLQKTARSAGFALLVEGSNADDLHDFRPGFQAVQELKVRSPLCEAGLTKAEVRELARFWRLSTAEKPSTPCLASRIAYGIEITSERLRQVELAEAWLAERGISPLRVRIHENGLARIETSPEWMVFLLQPENRIPLVKRFQDLGFAWASLDLAGFQSGSLNSILKSDGAKRTSKTLRCSNPSTEGPNQSLSGGQ